MDTNKPRVRKKKQISINPQKIIKEKYQQFVESIREENPNIPPQWLSGSDELINMIASKAPVEECVGLWDISIGALKFILDTDDPFGKWDIEYKKAEKRIVFHWSYLFKLAKEQNYREIRNLYKSDGKLMLALGYLSLFVISLWRLYLYLEDNPNARDTLYMQYGNEMEKDP